MTNSTDQKQLLHEAAALSNLLSATSKPVNSKETSQLSQIFSDYVDEVSDPQFFDEKRQYMLDLAEKGEIPNNKILIEPEPVFVARTDVKIAAGGSIQSLFVNFVIFNGIQDFRLEGNNRIEIPHVITPPRMDQVGMENGSFVYRENEEKLITGKSETISLNNANTTDSETISLKNANTTESETISVEKDTDDINPTRNPKTKTCLVCEFLTSPDTMSLIQSNLQVFGICTDLITNSLNTHYLRDDHVLKNFCKLKIVMKGPGILPILVDVGFLKNTSEIIKTNKSNKANTTSVSPGELNEIQDIAKRQGSSSREFRNSLELSAEDDTQIPSESIAKNHAQVNDTTQDDMPGDHGNEPHSTNEPYIDKEPTKNIEDDITQMTPIHPREIQYINFPNLSWHLVDTMEQGVRDSEYMKMIKIKISDVALSSCDLDMNILRDDEKLLVLRVVCGRINSHANINLPVYLYRHLDLSQYDTDLDVENALVRNCKMYIDNQNNTIVEVHLQ